LHFLPTNKPTKKIKEKEKEKKRKEETTHFGD
jgi:hypothetical protein